VKGYNEVLENVACGQPIFVCGQRMTIYTHRIPCGVSVVDTIKYCPSFILTKTFFKRDEDPYQFKNKQSNGK
jgi:hypothetical protein